VFIVFSEMSLAVPERFLLSAINYFSALVAGERAVPVANSLGPGWIVFVIIGSLARDKK